MHTSALKTGKRFFDTYTGGLASATVVDIGAQNINGALKDVCPVHFKFVGVDFAAGKGVDVVLDDPYRLPLADGFADVVVSSSCFEHSEMFWLLFLEILRILKPAGIFYLNVPSNGSFHRYPVDCWRFYPDSGRALVSWAKRSGYQAALLESFTGSQVGEGGWNDFVAVFAREAQFAGRYPARMLDGMAEFTNGTKLGSNRFLRHAEMNEDMRRLAAIQRLASPAPEVK